MRKYYLLAALLVTSALPTVAKADGFFGRQKDPYGFHAPLLGPRAAPWYLYWPYPAYFNTPAPTGVMFGPQAMTPGNFQPHMYGGMGPGTGFVPYPTNGFGQ